jgi:Flp pilus assembly protein TadB
MHTITSHPETHRCPSADQVVESDSTPVSSSNAEYALVAALLTPLAIVGLLILVGVGIGVAVCIMFVCVFAVTTTLDVRWLLRSRRDRNDVRRARE